MPDGPISRIRLDGCTLKRPPTAKHEAGRWHVCFSVEMAEPEPLPASELAVGIDLGLTTFATLSDGTEITNPRHFRMAERRLRIAQRKLAWRRKRSRRRQKARQEVARIHAHVVNRRRDFHTNLLAGWSNSTV